MERPIIEVKNIGKKYEIDHERGRYVALRDVLTNIAQHPFAFLKTKAKRAAGLEKKEDFWALKNISFNVGKGEVVGIIGHNGAGKSTLLKILSQITPPTEGEIVIRGKVGSLLEVGTGFHPELTGRENIFLNGAILGMGRREIAQKFDQIVEFAGIEKFIDTPVKRYSSGMYVRLAFSVAAHMEPDILIVDEVLAVGDAEFQKKCLGKMEEVTKTNGRTILFVSHNLSAIERLCEKTILLSHGKIKNFGPTKEIIQAYSSDLIEQQQVDLSERKDRKGSQNTTFNKVAFYDGAGNLVSNATSGQPLTVGLSYQSKHASDLKKCRASIEFKNLSGQTLFLCSSELTDTKELSLHGAGEIRCTIDKFPLTTGKYSLNIFLEANKQVEDWVNNAAILNVEDGDFYGTGATYPQGWAGKGVLVEHHWN